MAEGHMLLGVHVNGHLAGHLEWRQRPRRDTGWYLTGPEHAVRRLAVDPAIDALAADAGAKQSQWEERAADLALLSLPLALDRADDLLRGGRAVPESRVCAGVYELRVAGIDAGLLPYALPEAVVDATEAVVTITGHFDDPALARVLRRLALLGGRIVAIRRLRVAPEAGDPTPPSSQVASRLVP
jgi:hypothetical protein